MATRSEGSEGRDGSDGGRNGGWRFVVEALENVRCLHLLLFHASLAPDRDCLDFKVTVRHRSLQCVWNSPHGVPGALSVPLPPCLLDLSLPARCVARPDHVDVRLGLLSLDPALYRLQLSLDDGASPLPDSHVTPFSIEFDAKALESSEGVHFFCRECSCKLTSTPFRRVLEVPSMDWREVSEHFYGNCCCASFGAQAEFLVGRFQELLTPSEGTCLVASTTCIVHKGDVIVSEGDRDPLLESIPTQLLGSVKNDSDPCVASPVGVENPCVQISGCEDSMQKTNGSSTVTCGGEHVECCGSEHDSNKLGVTSETDSKFVQHQNSREDTTLVSEAEDVQEVCVDGNKASPEESEGRTHHDTEEDPCCSSSCSSKKPASIESSTMKIANGATPESLGNGFMTGPGSESEIRDWEPFRCRSCSSLLGARRGDSSKKGVQFFKHKISTHESDLSSSNTFREHTLERLFTHELEKNSESNSSYRYVLRSFQTGAVLLQLVLLNQSALVSSGTCQFTSTLNSGDPLMKTANPKILDGVSGCQTEDRKTHQIVDSEPENVTLETVVKFMFCDCRMRNADELRLVDKWAQLQNADDIFMLDEVAGTLIDLLNFHQMAYPPSCQSFQQFNLSFLLK